MKTPLSALHKYTLLYFYPKDNTPGCTLEAQDFTRLVADFAKYDIEIIGVSRDSEISHANFCQKHDLGITLVSDSDEILHNRFGVIGDKNNYRKIVKGVFRSTFLLDSKTGEIIKEWRNVRAKGHAERILAEIPEIL